MNNLDIVKGCEKYVVINPPILSITDSVGAGATGTCSVKGVFEDIRILLKVLQKLVDRGNTVIIIEHNMDVIKSSDWVIDLGPEGGDEGGQIISCGTPESLAENKKSYNNFSMLLKSLVLFQTSEEFFCNIFLWIKIIFF